MNGDNRNLIMAIALSMLILIVYQIYFIPDEPIQQNQSQEGYAGQTVEGLPATPSAAALEAQIAAAPLAATADRIMIKADKIEGSISLASGRIDDVKLLDYGEETLDDENRVALLRKSGDEDSYFTEVGFLDGNSQPLVDKNSIWQASGNTLTPETPVTLSHEENGIRFSLTYSIDDGYLITVDAKAENISGEARSIRHFARMLRNKPSVSDFFISYEGPIGVFVEDVKEQIGYDDIHDDGYRTERFESEAIKGWIGITDKFWLAAIIPHDQSDTLFSFNRVKGRTSNHQPTQVDVITAGATIADGASLSRQFSVFAGPKDVDVLESYNKSEGVERLDHAIDWGWFPFLTKPFFHALNWLNKQFGNFGLAIIALTVVVKLAFFPLANKSYKSMAKMRELAPKVQELRERFSDDRQRQQQEMMQLYRTEKVNPAAGCLPVLLQIPVFFALYKVLFIDIAMCHAPFYGWISDLGQADPTSILNLFGLLPYSTAVFPDFLNLGIWPILMGFTMFVQMSLNPPPPDPIQAKVFKYMPLFFTFLLATFPAGLVIYWTWNNILSIGQQWFIMQSVKKASAKKA